MALYVRIWVVYYQYAATLSNPRYDPLRCNRIPNMARR